ncbi:cytochrome c biogenesis protein [Dictyobacter arantiisoli]|uniref:Heme exporter protein C n=1 Tax=Dictyobacter arantiisoli TaxID=2014874 RepID=A0A5A5TAZ0_9CHLR|nr:cytochrome c biogenesis protein CcsA [Dictyobacter arantiisoli]GCF08326.1 cytochrome C biogenesis protein CcmC [Dictyobacter arantiisoli]
MALAKQISQTTDGHVVGGQRLARRRWPLVSVILGVLTALTMSLSIWLIFVYTPIDALQGETQRILYFHVPTAWAGMLSFVIMAGLGIIYLFKPDERLDWLARASAEVGVVFLTITLILGATWGKPIWGAWWVWDARLTATLILWFMYVGYLMLRSYMGRTVESARGGAVIGIIGAIDVPIIYLSVNWWRGQHPVTQIGTQGALPPQAVLTIMVALVAFTLLYAFMMVQAYQLQRLQTLAQRLRIQVE